MVGISEEGLLCGFWLIEVAITHTLPTDVQLSKCANGGKRELWSKDIDICVGNGPSYGDRIDSRADACCKGPNCCLCRSI